MSLVDLENPEMPPESSRKEDICLGLTHSGAPSTPAMPRNQLESSYNHSCLDATCRVSDLLLDQGARHLLLGKALQVVLA